MRHGGGVLTGNADDGSAAACRRSAARSRRCGEPVNRTPDDRYQVYRSHHPLDLVRPFRGIDDPSARERPRCWSPNPRIINNTPGKLALSTSDEATANSAGGTKGDKPVP